MTGAPNPTSISTKRQRIARLAREIPGPLNTLAHHIDIEWLEEAYRRTRKDGAVGVDGQSADDYARDLEANLRSLLDRAKSGTYRAPPVRRVEIPKAGKPNATRPIGISTFEDKILQRAVAIVLEAVYEQDFLDCSWGFRPARSAHGALHDLRERAMEMRGGWVVELDFQRFFDTLDHGRLREILHQRMRDGVLLRLICKWLKAGVLKEGRLVHPHTGTPQGGVISPLLANIYLHEVLDTWFAQRVRPRLEGRSHLVRYADDAVQLFEREEDARKVLAALPRRVESYGLRLHPEKTRLTAFRPRSDRPGPSGPGAGGRSFDFLGFTDYWARSRRGYWVIQRRTARDRFSRAGAFVTWGPPQILDMIARASFAGMKATWFNKWLVHRNLRPEVYAGRLHNHLAGAKSYDLHPDALNSAAPALLFSQNGTRLLPLSYPEGSPTHPTYPAGHATFAGATCTMVKAFFDEDFVLPDPVVPSADGSLLLPYSGPPLTVGGELDKLASNVAFGRDAAGVHYRSDAVESVLLGEKVAIRILADYKATTSEPFAGFQFTGFDGSTIVI